MTKPTTKPTESREIILDVLMEILEKGGYSHVILRQALEKYQYLEKSDRAFITRVVEGTIEYRLTIDAILDQCSKVSVAKMKPVIRTILRMSVYQILWMDRIPDSAVCNEAVNLTIHRHFQGLKGFVNGVLRTIVRQKDSFTFTDWSRRYSMPDWLIELWKRQYPAAVVESMLQAFLEDIPTTVRCNLDKASMEEISDSLERQGVEVTVSPLAPHALLLEHYDYLDGLEAFQKGWIQVQDVSSGFASEVANPRAGDQILDVCGAPGGKSLHLADKLKGTGLVVVRDLTEAKIRLVEDNLERTGFTNLRAEVWDAREFDPAWEEKADIVMADLPCSGFGIIGKKPDIKYQASPEKLQELVKLQQEILTVASRYVKPGGKLIYSTCTIDRMENEDQRSWFLEHFPFESSSLTGLLGESISEETLEDGYVQLIPGRYPCDGFFIAAFQKHKD
ncbi:MAG: 16S rRNA (cytosine(967)-C(5))-methyltransferase RsmB [Lachnospiraceae bacterium]|nr:16S rRNA (cytosine(967)-C(5))-methyltransferase RsmB [Lachnospiraceae bacterium]